MVDFAIKSFDLGGTETTDGLDIFGTSGDDVIVGTAGDDRIIAGFGVDTVSAGAGNDTITGGSNYAEGAAPVSGATGLGDMGEVIVLPDQPIEMLDGGSGSDTAMLSGDQSSYTLLLRPSGMVLIDRRAGGDGVDNLTNIEFLDFADELDLFGGAPMNLDLFGRQGAVGADDLESIIELYVAYFNRAPDALGLSFWADAFSKGTTLEEMASLFMQQDETLAAYPSSLTTSELVDTVYENTLGREPDAEGKAFWVAQLDAGLVSQDQLILELIAGAQAEPYNGASQGFMDLQEADRYNLATKTDIGAYYAVHRGMSNTDNAAAVLDLYDGTQTSIAAAKNAVDDFYAAALNPTEGEFLMPLTGVLDNPFDWG